MYKIVWRDRNGNIIWNGLTKYKTWEEADSALTTMWHYARIYIATIERI